MRGDVRGQSPKGTSSPHGYHPKRTSKADRQEWWRSLTPEQQSEYIAKKERSRKVTFGKASTTIEGKKEYLPEGHVKIWHNANSYSIYKPFMLDDNSNPLPEWIVKR